MSGKSASAAPDNHAVVDAAQLQLERLSAADAPYDTPRFKVDPEHLHVALQLQFASPGILVERLLGAPERRHPSRSSVESVRSRGVMQRASAAPKLRDTDSMSTAHRCREMQTATRSRQCDTPMKYPSGEVTTGAPTPL